MATWPDPLDVVRSASRFRRVGREAILDFQNRCLRRLVTHACRHVPYYRRLFRDSGLDPRDIRSVADLGAIPISDKNDFRAVPVQDTLARGVDRRRLVSFRTSGSSGEPFTVWRTWAEERLQSLYWTRAGRYFGQRATDRQATVRLFREGWDGTSGWDRLVLNALGLYRRLSVNCCLPPEQIVAILRRHRPETIAGYPGTLSAVADVMLAQGCRDVRPRLIIAGAQVLTPRMRQQIGAAFAAPVYNWYGSRELNCIGWECRETGELHTCDDNVIVEVLTDGRPARPGETGELVGTALHSFAMPFIRYRLADVVTKGSESCPCGEPFSSLRGVRGRMIDRFPLPGGRVLHPYRVVDVIEVRLGNPPWIRRYQLFQEREDRVELRVVPAFAPQREEVRQVEGLVRQLLGPGVEFEVRFVSDTELGPGDKFRVAHSLVRSRYDEAW